MLFNSLTFLLFFICVYGMYGLLRRSLRSQNWLLLAASYFFYACWDWRFLSLILFTTLLDYTVGRRLSALENSRRRKLWLLVSLVGNLSVLGFFKYFNFFAASIAALLNLLNMQADGFTLQIILPIGISFYTFQSLSYTIDVYKRRMEAVRYLPDYALFVAMFTQLGAGPIMRAREMLPQIQTPRRIAPPDVNAAVFLILWGYFKKVVIADNLALTANRIFDGYTAFHGLDLLLGLFAFCIQIYGDFSGYSDIARGLGRLLGFQLTLNFRLPYLAINPNDFWSRWNISLSSWLRDYIFWPLMSTKMIPAGRQTLFVHASRNAFLTMLLCGLWHGAAWNYVLWGGYYGVLQIIYRIFETSPPAKNPWKRPRAPLWMPLRIGLMFMLTLGGWLLFRSESTAQIAYFVREAGGSFSRETFRLLRDCAFFSLPLIAMQIYQYRSGNLLSPAALPIAPRILLYAFLLTGIFVFGVRESTEFIYLQF